MKLSEVKAAMQIWANARNQAGLNDMIGWLSQGNTFSYNGVPNLTPPLGTIHAYPGILNGKLTFFVISASNDKPNNPNIESQIQTCTVSTWVNPSTTSRGGDIDSTAAVARINAWKNGYQSWVTANITDTYSIFQAFSIPEIDASVGDQHNAFLALQKASNNPFYPPGTPNKLIGDIIVEDITNGSSVVSYYDIARPVPPFGGSGSGITQSSFYLLSLLS